MKTQEQIVNKMKVISKRIEKNFKRKYSEDEADSIQYWHMRYQTQLNLLSWLTGINKNKFVKSKIVN